MVDTRAAFYLLNINKNFVPIFLLLFINVKNYHSNQGRDAEKNLVDQNLSWAGDRVMQAGNRNGEHNRDDRLHLRRDLRTSRARENCNEIVGVSSLRWTPIVGQPEPLVKVYPRGFRCRLRSPLRRWLLYLQNPFDQSFCSRLCLWGCGRRRAFPRFPSWLGKRGKRSRSATPIVHISTGSPGKFAAAWVAEALVLALGVVKVQPGANTGLGFVNSRISMEVDLFVFEAAPQPLDKDVVHAPALAIHADHDPVPFQGAGKVVAGELAPLVGIEDFRPAMARERFLERLDAKIGVERVGETPGQHRAADPIHDHHQVEKALGHRDVGDVG